MGKTRADTAGDPPVDPPKPIADSYHGTLSQPVDAAEKPDVVAKHDRERDKLEEAGRKTQPVQPKIVEDQKVKDSTGMDDARADETTLT